MFLVILGTIIILVWAYCLFIREWLVATWPERFTWWHDLEDKLWYNSRTILVSRLYWVGGVVVLLHDALASYGFDWTPIMTQFTNHVPEQYRALLLGVFFIVTGSVFEWLRKITFMPLDTTPPPD
jgi:hypothetical protein